MSAFGVISLLAWSHGTADKKHIERLVCLCVTTSFWHFLLGLIWHAWWDHFLIHLFLSQLAMRVVAVGILRCLFIFVPFISFQAFGYYNMCHRQHFDEIRPWCRGRIPAMYNYIQGHYWYVKHWSGTTFPLLIFDTDGASSILLVNWEYKCLFDKVMLVLLDSFYEWLASI